MYTGIIHCIHVLYYVYKSKVQEYSVVSTLLYLVLLLTYMFCLCMIHVEYSVVTLVHGQYLGPMHRHGT